MPSRVRSTGLGANAHISGGKLRRGCCGLPSSRESAFLTVAGDAFILGRPTASYSYSCASTPGKWSPAAIRAFCPQFRAVRFSLHHTPPRNGWMQNLQVCTVLVWGCHRRVGWKHVMRPLWHAQRAATLISPRTEPNICLSNNIVLTFSQTMLV